MIEIIHAENLQWLKTQESKKYNLIYIDPPFNTGKNQEGKNGNYNDNFGDNSSYITFLNYRLIEAFRILKNNGSIFVHLDWREVHYVKIELDKIFDRNNFMNEIIWAYDYGGRTKKRWSPKHNNILWYVKNNKNYTFNYDEMDRIPYSSPKLVGPVKAEKGKTPNDCWWHTIVSPTSKAKTGYPTEKPTGILDRIIKVHSNENDLVLDFFAGSGSFGESAIRYNRDVFLVDENIQAIEVMKKRFDKKIQK